MQPTRGLLKVYLYLALLYGLLGLLDHALLLVRVSHPFYINTVTAISILFFLFNLVVIPLFIHQKAERIAFVLPAYHILMFIIFLVVGIALGVMGSTPGVEMLLLIIGIIASLFEVLFSAYLLRRFGFVPAGARLLILTIL